jgi:hypothetical protein
VTFGASQSVVISTPLTFATGGVSYSLTSCGAGCATLPTNVLNLSVSGTCSGGSCLVSAPASGNLSAAFVGPAAGGFAVAGTISSVAPMVTIGGAFKR